MECKNSISLKRKNVLLVAKTIKRKKERKKNDNKLNNSREIRGTRRPIKLCFKSAIPRSAKEYTTLNKVL